MARTRGGRRTCASRGAVVLLHVGLGLNVSSCALDFPKPPEVVEPQPAMERGASPAASDELAAASGTRAIADSAQDDEERAARPAVSGADGGLPEAAPPGPPIASEAPVSSVPAAQPDTGMPTDSSAPARPEATNPVEPVGETEDEEFVLLPVGFGESSQGLTFPERSVPPYGESPAFSWRGVPEGTRSLALVLKEQELELVNWVLWDISPSRSELPADLGSRSNPREVPGSSQMGSLSSGYSGPLLAGGRYEFTLWALDVEMLPDVFGRGVTGIADDLLPMHVIDTTEPVVVTYSP
jgi:hypothetical protein